MIDKIESYNLIHNHKLFDNRSNIVFSLQLFFLPIRYDLFTSNNIFVVNISFIPFWVIAFNIFKRSKAKLSSILKKYVYNFPEHIIKYLYVYCGSPIRITLNKYLYLLV